MAARRTIAIFRTDADAELAASVRGTLEGIPNEQVDQLVIKEFACTKPESLTDIFLHVQPELSILIEPLKSSFFAQLGVNGVRRVFGRSPFLLVLPENLARDAPRLLRAGASDFVLPPIRASDLVPRVQYLIRLRESDDELVADLKQVAGLKPILGQSPAFLAQLHKVPRIAACDATVLISGETGTGKELCARAVHYLSRRSDKPFVAVDSGAIPSELLENELFGHERGAYTSAPTSQRGLIQESEGGTLFLDEIDALSISMQSKILRFLQEKEYRPLGSPKARRSNVRIIAASNISLEEAVRAGKFRQDLYFRLNVLTLLMPPLRDRPEDIPILARHFLNKYAAEYSRPAREFTEEAVRRLLHYSFPGNARELENLIQRAVLACDGRLVDARDLELPVSEPQARLVYQARKDLMVANWERDELKRMLTVHRGNLSAIARAEAKDASAIRALLRKHCLRSDRASPYWDIRA